MVVLVGGGVGVTPQIACLKAIYRIRMSALSRIDHARRGHIKHVYFVWSAATLDVANWFQDVFDECLARIREDPTYPELHLYIHLSRVKDLPPGAPDYLYLGRPDFHKLMRVICQQRKTELESSQVTFFF